MQVIRRLPPKKTFLLARNTVTGQIYTGGNRTVFCGKPDQQQKAIDEAKAKFDATQELVQDGGSYAGAEYIDGKWVPRPYTGGYLNDVELFDHIPVLQLELKFDHIYHGTSGSAIRFVDAAGHQMFLRNSDTDWFFNLVGDGKIKMDAQGYYSFVVEFVKAGDKVYMELDHDTYS